MGDLDMFQDEAEFVALIDGMSSQPIISITLYLDGANESFCESLNKSLADFRNESLNFSNIYSENTSQHFIADMSNNGVVFETEEFLMSLVLGKQIYHPRVVEKILQNGHTELKNDENILSFSDTNWKRGLELDRNARLKMLKSLCLRMLPDLPFSDKYRKISERGFARILEAIGEFQPSSLGTEGNDKPELVTCTNVGTNQEFIDDIYLRKRWITVSVEFIIECLRNGKRVELDIKYVFTSKDLIMHKTCEKPTTSKDAQSNYGMPIIQQVKPSDEKKSKNIVENVKKHTKRKRGRYF